jgi:superfamily II DNA or RNA helicase
MSNKRDEEWTMPLVAFAARFYGLSKSGAYIAARRGDIPVRKVGNKQEVRMRNFVLVLAHRREIVSQTSQKLHDISIPHGIIMAGTQDRPLENVQVAAIQTLHRRAIGAEVMDLPPADLLVIDEAHHCPAQTYQEIIDQYPDAVLLGLTATPCRGDGRGLGGIFETIIECPQVAELINRNIW